MAMESEGTAPTSSSSSSKWGVALNFDPCARVGVRRRTAPWVSSFAVALARHVRPAARRAWTESGVRVQNDTEGIRTPAGRAQWISSPSP